MKPVSLRMEAFGPYATEAGIDFEPLADVGLFVVSGPTGSGKSTIFDAICFALYGSLSGARQSHVDVRSHYADPAAECVVELVFDAKGDRWRVTRRPAQIRRKRRGTGTTERPADAVLERWVDGHWHADAAKVRDVTSRCRDLVGLSLDQFERVVLLPQGKFADVLNARTADRAELLRTLFGSEIFERVGDVLAEEAKVGERALQGAAEQRDRFHRRAVEALDRAEAELADLPIDIATSLESAAIERSRLASQNAITPGTRPAGEGGAEAAKGPSRPDDVPHAAAQLSLLARPPEGAVDDGEPAGPAVHEVNEPGDPLETDHDPVVRLEMLRTGPMVDLDAVVASFHHTAVAARSDLERAEAQVKAIEQRRAAADELGRLDRRRAAMEALEAQLQTARSVAGLAPAIARRDQLVSAVADRHRTIDDRWSRVRGSVGSGVLGQGVIALGPTSSPELVSSLLEQTASRWSAIEALIAEEASLQHQRGEHGSLSRRVVELDAALADLGTQLRALAVERTALEAEARSLDPVLAEGAALAMQHEAAVGKVQARRRADDTIERLAILDRRLTQETSATAVAQAALDQAAEAVTVLDARIEHRRSCQDAVESAERRLTERGQIERTTAELDTLGSEVSELQARADEVFAAFVRGAAPRLAAELADGAPCPVCGSCDHPALAEAPDDHGLGGVVVDVATVEAASSAAAAAQARRAECRALLAALVADDPELAEIGCSQLEAALADARSALTDIDRAVAERLEVVEATGELELRLDATLAVAAAIEKDRAAAGELLAGLLGELGPAGGRTLDQLDEEVLALGSKLDDVERAAHRKRIIVDRLETITTVQGDVERRREVIGIDRATAGERLDHLATSIREAEAHRDDTARGADLVTMRGQLADLRQDLLLLQQLATAVVAAEASLDAAVEACRELITVGGFDCEDRAIAASMPVADVEAGEARHSEWVHRRTTLTATVEALDAQGLPEQGPDIDVLRQAAIAAETRRRVAADSCTSIAQNAQQASADLDEVGSIEAATSERRAHHELVRRVASVVRGNNSRRLSLENWVLSVYLHDVVAHANLHLHTMSNGRYRLLVPDAPSNQVGQHGLDLVIDDAHTGRVRPSVSLSGGETFQASLALALGLADAVMVGRAGLHLDALFVDEGFGSLDADAVDQAITVLDGLRSRGSMVGVITHVEALKNALPVAIEVHLRSDRRGSEIRQVA